MPGDARNVEVIVTVNDDSHQDIGSLSQRLSARGLKDAVPLASIGVISGSVHPDQVEHLRAEPGVAAVELAGGVQIPPPDSEVQ